MPDVKGMINDPQFQGLSLADQQSALSQLDPAFGQLQQADFVRTVQGIRGAKAAPNAGLAPSSPPPVVNMETSGLGNVYGFLKGTAKPPLAQLTNPIGISSQGVPVPANTKPFDIRQAIKNMSLTNAVSESANEATALNPIVTGQGAEGVGETASNIAMLVGGLRGGIKALPSKARASAGFAEVERAAANVPVDVSGPGTTALRMRELAGRGGQLPKVVKDFINRVTDPNKGPLTYQEARDFYSNASGRLSDAEAAKLKPNMKFWLGQFTRDLDGSIRDSAESVGKGQQYGQAMSEYRNAARLRSAAKEGAKWAGRGALGVGGAEAVKKLWKLVP